LREDGRRFVTACGADRDVSRSCRARSLSRRVARAAGVARVVLRAGTAPRISVRAKGTGVSPIALPVAVPDGVTVQLRRTDDAARCWGALYGGPSQNTPARFVAAR
jgi:hypothetical protein